MVTDFRRSRQLCAPRQLQPRATLGASTCFKIGWKRVEPPWRYLGNSSSERPRQRRSCTILGCGSLPLPVSWQKKAKDDRTAVDASSAACGGTVPSVRGFGRVDLQHATGLEKGASEMSEHAKYVRNCARGRSKDLSHRSMSLCLVQSTDHLASGRIMMSAGVDVRPVILGSTCHIRRANYGTPCTSLGLFQKTCENCAVTNNLA